MMKLAIFIPSRNTSATISSVIDRIPASIRKRASEIFVIDNASSDGTVEAVRAYKKKNRMKNLSVLVNEKNIGYGGSQKRAYSHCIENGYDVMVMLHSDGQYPPEMIPQLIKPLEDGKADLVFGSRISTAIRGRMPLWRYFGNRLITSLQNLIMGTHFTEFHSAFRAYDVHALAKVPFSNGSGNYHIDTDLLVLFKAFGFRILEISIPTHYGRESQSPSVLQTFNYALRVLLSVTSYRLHVLGIRRSKLFSRK